jgi:hypothetical protein
MIRPGIVFTRAALVLSICLAVLPVADVRADQRPNVQFSIGRGVSQEDADYIIEGTRLAIDVLTDEVRITLPETVFVSAREQSSPQNPSIIAASIGPSVVVYTGSTGWRTSPPFERVSVLVHELTHVMETAAIGESGTSSAAWFDEGLSEYLRGRALFERGLVKQADVDGYQAYQLALASSTIRLADIERLADFQRAVAPVYSLSYFAIAYLFDDIALATIARYYAEIGSGTPWPMAFADAFGQTPDDFYRAFDEWFVGIVAPAAEPAAFDRVTLRTDGVIVRVRRTSIPAAHPGDQVIFLAASQPGAVCQWQLTYAGKPIPAAGHLTFADGAGRLFWLLTLPEDVPAGTATVGIECGASPATFDLEIVRG